MIRKFLSIAFLGMLLVGCKESNAEAEQVENATPAVETTTSTPDSAESTDAAQQTQTQTTVQPQQQTNTGPYIQQQQTQQAPTTGQTAPGWSGKPNPPHGQPGHRCDVQVGAILP
ncbi:MAG: hypothetical protein AB7D46_04455 [Flavobacteriaceae bacterium]